METLSPSQSNLSAKSILEVINFTDPKAKIQTYQYKLMTTKVIYTIEMPGEIVSAENGKIGGNKVTYDVLELIEKGTVVKIESREPDVTAIAAVAFILLLLLGAITYYFFTLKQR